MKYLTAFLLLLSLGGEAMSLSWQDCLQKAQESNPELKAAEGNLEAAQQNLKGNYSGFLPKISANGILTRAKGGGTSEINTTKALSLNASQNLFAGFEDSSKVSQARANHKIAEENYSLQKSKVSFDLKNAFSGLLYAQELLKLSESILKRRIDNLKLVELRYEGGRENKGSVLLSEAALEQAKLEKLQAEHLQRQSAIQLAKVIGIDPTQEISIKGEVPFQPIPVEADFASLTQSSPEYKQSLAKEKAADAGLSLARAAFYPSLSLEGNLGKQMRDSEPMTNSWSTSLVLSIPLFSGTKDYYSSKEASTKFTVAKIQTQGLYRDLYLRLEEAFHALLESDTRLKVDQKFKEAARVRALIGKNQYQNALISFQNWDQVEGELITREKNIILSIKNRITSEAKWEQLQGKGALP